MRILILLLIVGFSFASAKYIPQEGDSKLLLRSKRSDSDESVASVQDNSEENDSSDSGDGYNNREQKRIEEQTKLREKEEKLRQKEIEKVEKERRKHEEQQRKIQEKLAKEERKEQEKKEKEERKRQERIEKEKRKLLEEERKVEEKLRKEQFKRQEKQQLELNNLQKEMLEQSDDDEFLETEEDSSVELEDIWKNHIYVKYGLNLTSTKLEKQAALKRYLHEELGLNANSTVSERRQAIVKLIQSKIETDPALRESVKKQILSQVNEVALQKLQTKLENDIIELDNKTELLNNITLPWATQAKQNFADQKTFLQTAVQFLSSLLPSSNINTTTNNQINELSNSGNNIPSENKLSSTDDNLVLGNLDNIVPNSLANSSNDFDKNKDINASVSATETSSTSHTKSFENSNAVSNSQVDGNEVTSSMKSENVNKNGKGTYIETDTTTYQNNVASTTDKNSLISVTNSSTKSPETNNASDTINIFENTITSNLDANQNGDWGQDNIKILNPSENKDTYTTVSDKVTPNIVNEITFAESNINVTPNPSPHNVMINTNENGVSANSDTLPSTVDNSVNIPSIHNDTEGNIIQNIPNFAIPVNGNSLPINTENSVNNSVINNNVKDNVLDGESVVLANKTVDTIPITISSSDSNSTNNITPTYSSSTEGEIASSVTYAKTNNDVLENEINRDSNNITTESSIAVGDTSNSIGNNPSAKIDSITTISKTTFGSNNSPSLNAETNPLINTAVTNNIEDNTVNVEKVIPTEKSGNVMSDVPKIYLLTTSGINVWNTDVVPVTENITVDVLSTLSPVDLKTKNSEFGANEVTTSIAGADILIINNSSVITILETTTMADVTTLYDNTTDNNATVVGTSFDSGSGSNTLETVENIVSIVTESVQPNSIPVDLLTSNVALTTEPTIPDQSSIASISASVNMGDTTPVAVTTETNPIDGIIVPVEPGAAVVEITSQTTTDIII